MRRVKTRVSFRVSFRTLGKILDTKLYPCYYAKRSENRQDKAETFVFFYNEYNIFCGLSHAKFYVCFLGDARFEPDIRGCPSKLRFCNQR